jgi:[protein-PII] uridylyltransferase
MVPPSLTVPESDMPPDLAPVPHAPRLTGGARTGQWQRERLRRYLERHPVEDASLDEVAAHFEGMPAHYWERVNEAELAWGIQTVHRFLHGLVASAGGGTPAVVTWRHFPRLGCTKVLVATWDRAGLLTKIAGYTSAVRLNIVRAEVYTRADNIVVDVFWLCDDQHRHISDVERLRQLAFLIDGGLSEPPRFVSTWACHSHKYQPKQTRVPTTVTFNNDDSRDQTILTVEATERLGLLHDMLQALGEHHLNINEAMIDTVDNIARDIFYVTDEQKRKIVDESRLALIQRTIIEALDA